jgi:hypothetical protein
MRSDLSFSEQIHENVVFKIYKSIKTLSEEKDVLKTIEFYKSGKGTIEYQHHCKNKGGNCLIGGGSPYCSHVSVYGDGKAINEVIFH